jgi:hypothetical protein
MADYFDIACAEAEQGMLNGDGDLTKPIGTEYLQCRYMVEVWHEDPRPEMGKQPRAAYT